MKFLHFVTALVGLLVASCSLDLTGKNACVTTSDCLSGLSCVNRHCQRGEGGASGAGGRGGAGAGAGGTMAPMDCPPARRDASSTDRDSSSDHRDAFDADQDRPAAHADTSVGARDGSVDRQDGSSDHQDSSSDRSSDSSSHRGDASSDRPSVADAGSSQRPVQGTCNAGTVNACPAAAAAQCQQVYCGGRLWRDGPHAQYAYIPYRIRDPNGLFSTAYRAAIRAEAAAWSSATNGLVNIVECSTCAGRFISVVPGSGDGVDESAAWEQLMPLPVDPAAPDNIPWHRIAHQWGHAIGLDDMYRRPNRNAYASFDPAVWCASGGSLPATCAFSGPTQQPGSPPIASGTFGPYDELSVMNGLPSEGVCSNGLADPKSGEPTLGDVSAVEELYFGGEGQWSPFQPIGRTTNAPDGPLDHQLAPGVDPVGGPAIAEWRAPSVDIVVRGTDGKVYETWNELAGTTFVDWADWTPVADQVNEDPALVFATLGSLHLVVRSAVDGSIRLRTRAGGTWGAWGSLGAPPVGAASAPAIAARDEQSLTVFVRGGDNLIYQFECTDPATMCAASAAAANAWTQLPAPGFEGFLGKPNATWMADGGLMIVSAIGSDHGSWTIGSGPGQWGYWIPDHISVSPEDPDPGAALASNGSLSQLYYFTRDANGLLLSKTDATPTVELGGMPISTPAAVATAHGDVRVDVAAVIDDHGHPGVWWKFLSTQNTPPCNYNAPGACNQCGCGVDGLPPCDF